MSKSFLITIAIIVMGFPLMIYLGQDQLIYFPRQYPPDSRYLRMVDPVVYDSGTTTQTAFLYPSGTVVDSPDRVWWFFGGNGSTALEWLPLLESIRVPANSVFVLVDYPGYGRCQGSPSPQSIFDSVDRLHETLCQRWSLSADALSSRSAVFGHSLGAAVALETAARHGMPHALLVSPFTSMKDMAKLKFGWLHPILKHHFDNREAVRRMRQRDEPVCIRIYHGDDDDLIPVSMGHELSELAGESGLFFEVKGAGHNDVLDKCEPELVRELIDWLTSESQVTVQSVSWPTGFFHSG